jgi:hypothetical protein
VAIEFSAKLMPCCSLPAGERLLDWPEGVAVPPWLAKVIKAALLAAAIAATEAVVEILGKRRSR